MTDQRRRPSTDGRGGRARCRGPRRALSWRRHAGDARRQRGRPSIDTHRARRPIRRSPTSASPARASTLGAGVTMATILANRDLAFLHPVARADRRAGGAQHGDRRRQPVRAAALRRFRRRRCWRSMRRVMLAGRLRRARRRRSRNSCATATRGSGAWSRRCRCRGPASRTRSASARSRRVKPKGVSVLSIAAHLPRRRAGASPARASPTARWGRRRSARRRSSARWRAARSMPPAIAPALRGRRRGHSTRRPMRSRSAWYRREVAGVHLRRLLLGERKREADGQDAGPVSPQRRGRGGRSSSGGAEPARCAAPRRRRYVAEVRLRPGHLRRLHRADRRRAAARLPDAGRDLRRPRDRDGGRASPTGPTCTRCRTPSWSTSPPSAASARRAC